jgi:multiple sugar transport system permease protein
MVQKINKTSLKPDFGCFVLFDGGFTGLVVINFTAKAALEVYTNYMRNMGMPEEELAISHTSDEVGDVLGELMNQLVGDFTNKIRNTAFIAGMGMAGTILSSTLVAYGLSRFRIPFKGLILASLVATIILPRFVTLVPTYIVFERIGWVGTWWPLIIPHFFANAYNVFLLRQFFLTIPRDLDEAASIDGAGPFTTLVTVILPQAKGAILAVALFHFFFAWNDFLEPLLYLSTEPDKQPISVGLYFFLGLYDANIPLIQSGALLGMAIPILVYLALQKVFLGGIDLSGSMK